MNTTSTLEALKRERWSHVIPPQSIRSTIELFIKDTQSVDRVLNIITKEHNSSIKQIHEAVQEPLEPTKDIQKYLIYYSVELRNGHVCTYPQFISAKSESFAIAEGFNIIANTNPCKSIEFLTIEKH